MANGTFLTPSWMVGNHMSYSISFDFWCPLPPAAGGCGSGRVPINSSDDILSSTLTSQRRRKGQKWKITIKRKIKVSNMDSESVTETEEGIYLPKPGMEEIQMAMWLNRITTALRSLVVHKAGSSSPVGLQTRAKTPELTDVQRHWSAEFAVKPTPTDLDMKMKPDIALLQSDSFDPHGPDSWRNVMSFLELSTSRDFSRIAKQLVRKAYAVFVAQPGRYFVPVLSITHSHFRLHIFDCAGVIHSCAHCIHQHADYLIAMLYTLVFTPPKFVGYDPTIFFSPVIQQSIQDRTPPTIQIGNTTYIIIRLLFSSHQIRGRATLCFVVIDTADSDERTKKCCGRTKQPLGVKLPKQYVVKTSWTRVEQTTTKEEMLPRIKERGLKHGVPTLVKAWTVQIDEVDDSTALCRPDHLLHHLGKDKRPEI